MISGEAAHAPAPVPVDSTRLPTGASETTVCLSTSSAPKVSKPFWLAYIKGLGANSVRRWFSDLSQHLSWTVASSIFLLAVWLNADLDAVGGPSEGDDGWFVRTAASACWFGTEDYSSWTLYKEPSYPLFVAMCYQLGIRLRVAQEAFYLAAGGFLAWSLAYRQTRSWVGLVVFAAVAFNPLHFTVLQGVYHDPFYASLLMLVAAALLWQYKRRGEPGRWRRWLHGYRSSRAHAGPSPPHIIRPFGS
jgi:hypothetical protein